MCNYKSPWHNSTWLLCWRLTNISSLWKSNSDLLGNQPRVNAFKFQVTPRQTLPRTDPTKSGQNTYTIANSCPAHTNSLCFFSYGERGQLQTTRPKQIKHGLVIQETDDEEPQYNDYDEEHGITTDVLHGDTCLNLVLRRNCLLLRASQESWLCSNLFRSTCTINGKVCKLIIHYGSCANVISNKRGTKIEFGNQTPSITRYTRVAQQRYRNQSIQEGVFYHSPLATIRIQKHVMSFLWTNVTYYSDGRDSLTVIQSIAEKQIRIASCLEIVRSPCCLLWSNRNQAFALIRILMQFLHQKHS